MQATLYLGDEVRGQRQPGLIVVNVYLNPVKDKLSEAERNETCAAVMHMIEQAKKNKYHIIVLGDMNVALSEEDRSSKTLTNEDVSGRGEIEKWGLIDIWKFRHEYQFNSFSFRA